MSEQTGEGRHDLALALLVIAAAQLHPVAVTMSATEERSSAHA